MEQLISVIPYVKELTGITDEARKVVEQQVAEFALSIKTSKLDSEQLEMFFKKPYYLEPVHGRPDSWHLIIPKFVDIQIGWLERSTDSFNVFLINRYMDWLGEIPEAIKRQLNWKAPPELILDGEELHGPKGALEYAWQKYRPFLHDRDENKIRVNPKRAFDLIASMIKDGVLPFSIKPVDNADLMDRKCDFQLRDYQLQAWNELKRFSAIGVYYPPSTGKTFIGLWVMTHLKPPHLVVVPTRLLQEQWIERIQAHTDLQPGEYEVMTYQSAISKASAKSWVTLIIDETHHQPANSFVKLSLIKRKYTLGLSATPMREDGREEYVFALSGRPVGLNWDYFKKLNLIKSPVCHVWIVKNFETKLRRLASLLQEDMRTIIFSDSLETGKAVAGRFKIPFVYGATKDNMTTILENRVVVISRVGDEGMSLPDIERVIEVSWLFGCYDEASEVLTRIGWKPFKDVSFEDEIATRDPSTGFLEYQKPTDIQRYDYQGPMVHFSGRSYDLFVTPENRMFVRHRGKDFTVMRAEHLASKSKGSLVGIEFSREVKWEGSGFESYALPKLEQTEWIKARVQVYNKAMQLLASGKSTTQTAAKLGLCYFTVNHWVKKGADPRNKQFRAKNIERVLLEPYLKLLAWYISEGSIDHDRLVKIAQTDSPHRAEIALAAREAGFKPYMVTGAVCISSKQLAQDFKTLGHAEEKFIPRWVLELQPSRLRILLSTLLKGDGNGRNVYYTSSKRLADDVQELGLKCGYGTTIGVKKKPLIMPSIKGRQIKSIFPQYSVCIAYHHLTPQIWTSPLTESYEGKVYDVTVPNGVILVRRKGRAVWSGNSRRQELQRTTRLLHSEQGTQESHILMTLEEYLHDRKRLFSIMDKGFKIVLHREGVSEKVIENHSGDYRPLPQPRNSRPASTTKSTAIIPLPISSSQSGTYTSLPGVQRMMALMTKKEKELFILLLDHDGEWFKREKLPLLLGYANVGSMVTSSINLARMVNRGSIDQKREGNTLSYRTNMKGKLES